MSKEQIKTYLEDLSFEHETAHIAYTLAEEGGAASLMNDAFLFKAEDIPELTDDIIKALNDLGIELPDEGNTSEAATDASGVSPSKVEKSNGEDMTPEEIQEMINKAVSPVKDELDLVKAENEILKSEKESRELDGFIEKAKAVGIVGDEAKDIAKSWKTMNDVSSESFDAIYKSLKDNYDKVAEHLGSEQGHEQHVDIDKAKQAEYLAGYAANGGKVAEDTSAQAQA